MNYVLYGAVVAHSVRPDNFKISPGTASYDKAIIVLGTILFFVGEAGNMYSHMQLKWTRMEQESQQKLAESKAAVEGGPATKWGRGEGKAIMKGGLFNYVTCAHYFYELPTWLGFAIACRWAGGATMVWQWSLGGLIMGAWGRHKNYKEYFNGKDGKEKYPEHLKAIIPFVV
jgi:very-long-chain enoyl-CoA reductase